MKDIVEWAAKAPPEVTHIYLDDCNFSVADAKLTQALWAAENEGRTIQCKINGVWTDTPTGQDSILESGYWRVVVHLGSGHSESKLFSGKVPKWVTDGLCGL